MIITILIVLVILIGIAMCALAVGSGNNKYERMISDKEQEKDMQRMLKEMQKKHPDYASRDPAEKK